MFGAWCKYAGRQSSTCAASTAARMFETGGEIMRICSEAGTTPARQTIARFGRQAFV